MWLQTFDISLKRRMRSVQTWEHFNLIWFWFHSKLFLLILFNILSVDLIHLMLFTYDLITWLQLMSCLLQVLRVYLWHFETCWPWPLMTSGNWTYNLGTSNDRVFVQSRRSFNEPISIFAQARQCINCFNHNSLNNRKP